MKRVWPFILKVLVSAVLYSVLLLPFQMNLPLFNGTDIRPSAFVPVVLGIFWGLPAAVGIFIGNLVCDIICLESVFIILGSVINGLSALCARQIFFASWNHPMTRGQYIYSLGSLTNFILTVLIIEFSVACPISLILHFYSEVPIPDAFLVIFQNNVHSNIFFGIPIMLFLPLLNRWADPPRGHGSRKRIVLACTFLASGIIPVLCFMFTQINWSRVWTVICLIPMTGAILTYCATPTVERDPALFGFRSLKTSSFRRMMLMAILTSVAVCLLISYYIIDYSENFVVSVTNAFHICAMVEFIFLTLFAFSVRMTEKNLVAPLHNVASKLSLQGEIYKNELDIISKRLDFVVSSGAEHLSSDEFSIIIGLTSKDNSKRYSVHQARSIINDICLEHVTGYISSIDGVGGYKGDEHSGMEQMLIYTIYGATDEQIKNIANDVIHGMNQDSVLIEKNRLTRYYYYGEDNNT